MLRMPEERENELVLQAQKGSTKAFTELEKQYHWLVFKVAKDILCDVAGKAARVEAEDATQDVFEYAFVHIKDYKMPSRFYRWLWSLAKVRALRVRHKLLNDLKYTDSRDIDDIDFAAPDSWTEAVDDLEPYVKAYAHGKDLRDLFNEAIETLPKRQREDLTKYAKGKKPRHIAKETGRNVEAVKFNLKTAKKKIRENYPICKSKGYLVKGADS